MSNKSEPKWELTDEEIQDIIKQGIMTHARLGVPKERQAIDRDIATAAVAKVEPIIRADERKKAIREVVEWAREQQCYTADELKTRLQAQLKTWGVEK